MNNGKICVAVCAKTFDDLFQKIESSKPLCDIVEIRFDSLEPADVERVRESLSKAEPSAGHIPNYITTFRPREQGGHRDLTVNERLSFWGGGAETKIADVEEDIVKDAETNAYSARICSLHDFERVPEDLSAIFKRLAATGAEIIKIAAKVDDTVDSIPIWHLLQFRKPGILEIIPIAMGEAGKWTRILGVAHGAFLTYAAPTTTDATAPGQITARDMINVYRVKELDEWTQVYGIIAGDTSYSMSPYIHNAAFKTAGLNAVFIPFQVSDLDAFMTRMVQQKTREVELNFCGFSVTNPHKRSVISYLDETDDAAKKIGAVNTVKIVDGKLHGYNTDAEGFIKPLKEKFPDLNAARVAVVGAGGAARACVYALLKENAAVTVYARDREKARELVDSFEPDNKLLTADGYQPSANFSSFDIVVNTTPLGTQGHLLGESVATADQLKGVRLVYDLTYNPAETQLLREANAASADTLGGFDMLLCQAAKQFEIWTGQHAPVETMASVARKKLNDG
jgi:3-dehydroquinate dehydratase/shikimate dehydrogenase